MRERSTAIGLGTLLRHLLELLDGDVQRAYDELGLDYRPRYTPVVAALLDLGPSSIQDIARAAGITHSAASQTVAQMAEVRAGLAKCLVCERTMSEWNEKAQPSYTLVKRPGEPPV